MIGTRFTMEESQVARVLQDFFTTNEGELSLQKGDIVQIIKKTDKLWCFGCHNGKMGNMPLNYLIIINCPNLQEGEEIFAAIANFSQQQSDDLSFEKGELIVGIRQVGEHWWEGRIGSRVGMFPTTYTWQLDSSLIQRRNRPPPQRTKARVEKDMKAQLDEEIDLHAGDIITIIEVIDKDWYRGESRGKMGIFPAAFVTTLTGTGSSTPHDQLPSASNSSQSTISKSFLDDVDDCPPSYNEVFGSSISTNSVNSSEKKVTLDVFEDDYFKQNAPNTFFMMHNENHCDLLGLDQSKDLGIFPYGISLYPFRAQFDNELSFDEGEIVTLIRYISNDWMEGKVNEQKGIFPCSYVNVIVDCDRDSDLQVSEVPNCLSAVSLDLENESFAVVIYNFDAQMNGDISVKEGEVVYILELANNCWCKVRNQSGQIGLCPRNYLTLHASSENSKTIQHQRYSLANDNLLQDLEKVDVVDRVENKSCHHQDFTSRSRGACNVDDLISLNIDNLKSNNTWHPKPKLSMRSLSEIFECNSNKCPPERSDFDCNIPENVSSSTAPLDWQKNISESTSGQSSSLRDHNTLPNVQSRSSIDEKLQPSQFDPPSLPVPLKRQMSDRVPHRPAPPVPLPGQKPVRRPDISELRSVEVKEKQLKYLLQVKEDTLMKMNSKQLTDVAADEVYDMKRQIECCEEKIKNLTSDLETLKGQEPSLHSQEVVNESNGTVTETLCCSQEERRLKNLEQRQNVISELVMTEKEYVRDLKITFEVFNLHDPSKLENRGINVKILFGNIGDVMRFAEDFLDQLLFSMKGKDEDKQCVGIVFLEMAEKMKNVYGNYCMNHDNALFLLEKYETEQEIQRVFNKGLETLRYQIACFDMSSILIKPVQRILKYPLILNELIKCTSDSHEDKPVLLQAVKTIMDVATYINECKRRKDIVSKYLVNGNDTISSKMSRLNLHSVAKKSTRFGMLVSSTLGFGAVTKDAAFIECEASFHSIDKTIRTFLKNIESFIQHLHEVVLSQCYIAEGFAHFYQEKHSDVEEFSKIQKLVNTQYFKEFESTVQSRVFAPLNTVLTLFEGPEILIQKQHDKFLDYNACAAKAEKNKDVRIIQEELSIARNNYQALNDQLLEELPTLVSVSTEIFVECLYAFMTARKLFTAKVMKHYLAVIEKSNTASSTSDVVESCCVRYNLVLNQLYRLNFFSAKKSLSNSPTPKLKLQSTEEVSQISKEQTSSQRAYLQSRYGSNVYSVIIPCIANEPLELKLNVGQLVGVIKKQNPMGDPRIWFVDDGGNHGFVPSNHLKQAYPSPIPPRHSAPPAPSSYSSSTLPRTNTAMNRMHTGSLERNPSLPPYRSSVETAHYSTGTLEKDTSSSYSHAYESISDGKSTHYSEIPEEAEETSPEVYCAMYDFQGDNTRTLSVRCGQIVKILQKHDAENNSEWWLAEDSNGKRGFVPGNFLGKKLV